MWSEFVSPETIDSRLWPRTAAVAERLWSPEEVRDLDDMYRRLEIESTRLEALGLKHRANYAPMLERITGGKPIASLRVLADLVEPVKLYRRGEMRTYTSATPLDRLVDAARPESMAARHFSSEVDRLVREGPKETGALRKELSLWKDNHTTLDPILAPSPLGLELRSLSRELSEVGRVGLEALSSIESGKTPEGAWREQASHTLERAGRVEAEVELAIVAPVRKLVLAAENADALKGLPGEKRNEFLDGLQKKSSTGEP